MIRYSAILTVFVLTVTTAWAQKASESKKPSTPKSRTVKVRFDDELVKGSTEKPDLTSLNTKTDFNYKRLIRVRENFVNEMEDGLDDFKGN